MQYRPSNANLDSGYQIVYIVNGDNGYRQLSVVTPGQLCWPFNMGHANRNIWPKK